MNKTLYSIGLGPGDKELVTLKAINILKKVDILFIPKSRTDSESFAYTICKDYIKEDCLVEELIFPMIKDKEKLEIQWEKNIQKIRDLTDDSKTMSLVTIGDPMVYSSSSYITDKLKDEYNIINIPAVTSFVASACSLNLPIVQGSEKFCILTLIKTKEEIIDAINKFDTVIFMKITPYFSMLQEVIKEEGIENSLYWVTNATLDNELIQYGYVEEKVGYFTTLIYKRIKG